MRIADVDAAGQLGGEGRQARQHVVERFAVGKADSPGETPGVEPRCADCEPEAFVVETVVVAAAAVVMLLHGGVDFGDLCAAPVKIRTRTTVCLPNGRLWKTFVAVSAYSPRRNDVGIISRAIRRRLHRKQDMHLAAKINFPDLQSMN